MHPVCGVRALQVTEMLCRISQHSICDYRVMRQGADRPLPVVWERAFCMGVQVPLVAIARSSGTTRNRPL